jgi:DNA-binding CsgD family transcriptional regulator
MAGTGSVVSNARLYDIARHQLSALVSSLDDSVDDDYETSECVLMDEDIAGRRYLLVRMRQATRIACSLSPRELEIVRLIADGHPNKVIAAVLDISAWTVCTHIRRVFMKLGVTSRAAMVAPIAEILRHNDGSLHARASRDASAPQSRESRKATATPLSFDGEKGREVPRRSAPNRSGSGGTVRTAAGNVA